MSQGGHLEQYDTPAQVLAEPANDFVIDFLGAERGLKRLALIPVSDVKADPGPVVRPGQSRADAERIAAAAGTDWVVIVADSGRLLGWRALDELADPIDESQAHAFATTVNARDSLRAALDAMVTSRTGVAVRVADADSYQGILTPTLLSQEIV
jgi:osmoprotectant transport system ATP-binding protein